MSPANLSADPPAAERATYRHGNLRAALLDAGVALAREGGPAAIVLREATRQAGVAPNAAYRHFANRQALLEAVRAEALAQLARVIESEWAEALQRVQASEAAGRARALLRSVGVGYLRFAQQEPGLFRTAFAAQPFTVDPAGVQPTVVAPRTQPQVELPAHAMRGESGRDPFELLGDALDALVQAGVMAPSQRPGAEFMAWAAVHGLAVLLLDGPLRGQPEAARDALAHRLVHMVERGLSAPA